MSGMEPIAIAALASGTALQAYGSVMRGKEESRAATFEQQQLELRSKQEKTAAAQDETRRREELTSSLETIQAIRAGRGVGSTSPTALAIYDSSIEDAERDIGIARENYLTRAEQSRQAAEMAGRKSRMSLLAGYLGAGEAVASAGYKYATLGRYPVPAPRSARV